MKAKTFVFLFLAGLVGLLVASCGRILEYNTYYYPNWMPDGRIICLKVYNKSNNTGVGKIEHLETRYYVAAMHDDGSNEQNLFEASTDFKEVTCSPTGELMAYVTVPDGKIIVSNYSGSNRTTLPGISNAQYLDWSPDATKIVYSNSSRELHVVNVDGTSDHQIANSAEAVAWRVGERIVYEQNDGGSIYISAINEDGSNNSKLHGGQFPQKTNVGTVIFRTAGNIKSINIDGTGYKELFANYDRSTLELSFANTKITGGNPSDMWVVNIDGINLKQIR